MSLQLVHDAVEMFPAQTLDRNRVVWEGFVKNLSPVERKSATVWLKREDQFAPLGYGGINGSKLRQLIYLVNRYARGCPGIISAGSVKSPQHCMQAVVAAHYGLESVHILGATTLATCLKHESPRIAKAAEAVFEFCPVAFNPALQSYMRTLARTKYPRHYVLEYAISLDHKRFAPQEIQDFHAVGAAQVNNLPREVETLVIPAGSCVTATSVLYGLAQTDFPQLRTVHLIGVGHADRVNWMRERLEAMGVELTPRGLADGYTLTGFNEDVPPYTVHYHDLVGRGYAEYQQMWKEDFEGVIGHPTYEAKAFRYLKTQRPEILERPVCFWIIGSEPRLTPTMATALGI